MFLKHFKIDMNFFQFNGGIILIDIVLALTLATIFVAIISTEFMSARMIFDRAQNRETFLNYFETDPNNLQSNSQPFGNDLIQKDRSGFIDVSLYGNANLSDSKSTPFCSVDYFNDNVVGSYGFGQSTNHLEHLDRDIKITPITLPINPSLPLTDFQIRNGIAYVSADSYLASDPDLLVIDFRDLNIPKLISSINTGPGITAIALADNHIYAAAPSTAAQLQIIRLNDLSSTGLVLENKYKLPLPTASTTSTKGSSVFYYKNKIYLGTEKWDGDELSVIDITDMTNPDKIGGFETGGKIKDIFIHNDLAYLAGADLQQLRILDISNPTNPILVSSFSPSGSTRQEGNTVSTFENSLNFGRTSGGFNIVTDQEFFGFNSASSSSSSKSLLYSSLDIPGGVYGIVQDRQHVFLATRQLNKEFQIYTFSTSTSNSSIVLATSSLKFYSLPVAPQKMTCDGDLLYILSATAPVIYAISFN